MEGAKRGLAVRSGCTPQGQPPTREGYLHVFSAPKLIPLQERAPCRHQLEQLVRNSFQIAFQPFRVAGAGQRRCCPATTPSATDKEAQPWAIVARIGFFFRVWLPFMPLVAPRASRSSRSRCLKGTTSLPRARWRWSSMASLRAEANVSGAPSTGSPSPSLPVRSAGPSVSFAGLPLGRRNRSAQLLWPVLWIIR
jgi:hypothetical protein